MANSYSSHMLQYSQQSIRMSRAACHGYGSPGTRNRTLTIRPVAPDGWNARHSTFVTIL